MDSGQEHLFEVNENVLEFEGYRFFIAYTGSSFRTEHALIYDAIIIESGDLNYSLHILKKIRAHLNPEFYLKPIFMLKGNENRDPLVNNLIDGVIYSLDQVKMVIPVIQQIYLKIADLSFTKSLSFEAQMIDKVLNLLYTRDKKELNPLPYFNSGIGYTFPEISINFNYRDEFQVLDIMEIAEKEGLFAGEYLDRIYLCNSCSGGYLSFREVCPHCGSTNADSEDLIHHFPCAYIGPISDFKNEIDNQLNCPKCNKMLRHIGVDYDKPSIIYTCGKCSSKFQDISVKAKCMVCTQDTDVQYLIPKHIKSYRITKKGETSAQTGYVSTSKDIEDFIGTVKLETFKTMIKYEIERLKQTDYSSNVAGIYLKNAGELYSMIGASSQRALLRDLVEIIRRNIRSSDLISFQNVNVVLLSLNEIPTKVADNILKEICGIISRLISKNFKNFEVDIKYNVLPLNTKLSHELQIQQLTKDFGD
ncbi:MAG: hypothetical protein K1X56_04360 [Flavobacteriales bacterium]|nr:hypothetical protein [Flavobacteriales bacterium]